MESKEEAAAASESKAKNEAEGDDEDDDDEDEEELRGFTHRLTDMPKPSPKVPNTNSPVVFLNFPNQKFALGTEETVLIGFKNAGDDTYKVDSIAGSMNVISDFSLYIQNLTEAPVNHPLVSPGQEATLNYSLPIDWRLDSDDYTLAITVFYTKIVGWACLPSLLAELLLTC